MRETCESIDKASCAGYTIDLGHVLSLVAVTSADSCQWRTPASTTTNATMNISSSKLTQTRTPGRFWHSNNSHSIVHKNKWIFPGNTHSVCTLLIAKKEIQPKWRWIFFGIKQRDETSSPHFNSFNTNPKSYIIINWNDWSEWIECIFIFSRSICSSASTGRIVSNDTLFVQLISGRFIDQAQLQLMD